MGPTTSDPKIKAGRSNMASVSAAATKKAGL